MIVHVHVQPRPGRPRSSAGTATRRRSASPRRRSTGARPRRRGSRWPTRSASRRRRSRWSRRAVAAEALPGRRLDAPTATRRLAGSTARPPGMTEAAGGHGYTPAPSGAGPRRQRAGPAGRQPEGRPPDGSGRRPRKAAAKKAAGQGRGQEGRGGQEGRREEGRAPRSRGQEAAGEEGRAGQEAAAKKPPRRRRRPRRPPRRRPRRPRSRPRRPPVKKAAPAKKAAGEGRAAPKAARRSRRPRRSRRRRRSCRRRSRRARSQKLRERLESERDRHLRQAEELTAEAELLASEREQGDTQFDEESGEGDTVNVERERDLALSATARQTVDDIDRALRADVRQHVRPVRHVRRSHPARAARGDPVGRAVREVQGPWRTAPLTDATGRRRSTRRAPRWVVAALVAIVALDQLTKTWAVAALADGPKHVIGDTVEFDARRATAAARSAASRAYTPILAVGAIVVTCSCSRACARRRPTAGCSSALVLVLGGALGNLVRPHLPRRPGFLRGHVVDFVAVGWWPVFNVADSCVTIGAILLDRAHAVRAAAPTAEPSRARLIDASRSRCRPRSTANGSTARSRSSPAGAAADVQALLDARRDRRRRPRRSAKSHRLRRGHGDRAARRAARSDAPPAGPTRRSTSTCATPTTT